MYFVGLDSTETNNACYVGIHDGSSYVTDAAGVEINYQQFGNQTSLIMLQDVEFNFVYSGLVYIGRTPLRGAQI